MRKRKEVLQENMLHPIAEMMGGGSIYRQMLPLCDTAYVTKVHCTPQSDTFFPNLDESPDWELAEILQTGEENGVFYDICRYIRKIS